MSTHTQREQDLANLAAGGFTGWWDETGNPAPWPDDFFDPDTDWRPDTQLVTPDPDEAVVLTTPPGRSTVTPRPGT